MARNTYLIISAFLLVSVLLFAQEAISATSESDTCKALFEAKNYELAAPACVKSKDYFQAGYSFNKLNKCQETIDYYSIHNSGTALVNLGIILRWGTGACEKDVPLAVLNFEAAADKGHAPAHFFLAGLENARPQPAGIKYHCSHNPFEHYVKFLSTIRYNSDWLEPKIEQAYGYISSKSLGKKCNEVWNEFSLVQFIQLLNSKFFMEDLGYGSKVHDLVYKVGGTCKAYNKIASSFKGQYAEVKSLKIFHAKLLSFTGMELLDCLDEAGLKRFESTLTNSKKNELQRARKTKRLMKKAEAFRHGRGELQDFREAYFYYLLVGKRGDIDVSEQLDELRAFLTNEDIDFAICVAKKGEDASKLQRWLCK